MIMIIDSLRPLALCGLTLCVVMACAAIDTNGQDNFTAMRDRMVETQIRPREIALLRRKIGVVFQDFRLLQDPFTEIAETTRDRTSAFEGGWLSVLLVAAPCGGDNYAIGGGELVQERCAARRRIDNCQWALKGF